MTILQTAARRLVLVAAGCLLAVGIAASPAFAGYGEVNHFGEAGTGKGQFNLKEAFGATDALGVDQTTDAVYVVDGPTKKEYRLQKFELESGKWVAVAERKFKPAIPRVAGVEGVAVDHADNRVYVLVNEERGEDAKVDAEVIAAGELYAFDASNLEPASGTTEGVLAGNETLKALSNTAGEAILEPSGIAVDPTTGDVIVLGSEDPVGEDEELRVVLERISSTGTVGDRWIDTTDFFGGGGEVIPEVTSPVVTSTGKVYVADGELPTPAGMVEEIDEVPSDFASTSAPTPLTEFNSEGLITFPGIPFTLNGGGLSLGPEGDFYAYAQVLRQEGSGFHEPAVLSFSPSGSELGWFGGENQPTETPHVACAISFRGHPVVAAGTAGTVFVFDSDPASPDVVEFGPGGSGCPTASTTPIAESVNNEAVSGPVAVGAKVKFSSTLKQANALDVEWEFTNKATKATEKVSGPADEFQAPEITHALPAVGEYAVKETITTDDLATPTLVQEATITAKAAPPTAQFSVTSPVLIGEADRFDASHSSGNGVAISSYTWSFGDGSAPVTSGEPTISHAYSAAGLYTVTLTVKSTAGGGEATHQVEVVAGGGGGGGGGGTPLPSSGSGGGSSSRPSSASVLSYKAGIAGSSFSVASNGAVVIKVACQGQSSCSGTVTLRTLNAVATRTTHKAILTLGSASFSATGGSVKSVTIHLSAKARALLAKSHVLKALATIVARDAGGASHTSTAVVSLKAAKGHGKH